MALNNRDRVGKAFESLAEGLHDPVDEVMTEAYGRADWDEAWAEDDAARSGSRRVYKKTDPLVQLNAIKGPPYRFGRLLSRSQQAFAVELVDARHKWAHNEPFASQDASRALDTIERLLQAVGASHSADDVRKLREDLDRTVFEEKTRTQVRRTKVSLDPGAGLKPWRDVIRPHDDVARGDFNASEFAADLHKVHTGQTLSDEYSDPVEFFSRTYLTEGLRDLLARALRRLNGDGNASPVVNLQTNFGGGKTHSMLALYHLFSGTPASRLPQELQELVAENGNPDLSSFGVKRVALVGTYLQADDPLIKDDGTEVRTIWGELAWQLGGREGYDIVAGADASGTNPGEALRTLLQKYSPALILIDEWVAYARMLVSDKERQGGSFDAQFTFAQSLTEIVSSLPGTMLVVSIPASDTGVDGQGSDIEIGGANGQLALERLQNVIRRVADQWRPSTKDESFEIVRRRLFQAPNAEGLNSISAVARSFVTMYRNNIALFPRDATVPGDDYEKRIRASYPLHPELLDRLYEDWSTLERFQRTRGVLKLVSAIVHELWASSDASPLILPGNVPLDATSVNTDLTQYLEDQWKPIIDSDIDGVGSTAHQIDLDRPNLGQRFVTQRIARTIFIGAAPRTKSARKGIDKQFVWLGTATPGDTLGNFGSAVELLAQRSTYFYEEQGHYWFDTQPSVTKTASDYAEQLREDVETVWNEIRDRLQPEDRARGVFDRVHTAIESSADIPDLEQTRLVIAHPRHSRSKQHGADSAAHEWVRDAIESKGGTQRVHRNTLVFLIADKNELEGLEAAVRSYLGWKKVQAASDSLNLTKQQHRQADDWVARLNQTVTDRVRDTFVWALYPEQADPKKPFTLVAERVPDTGAKSLAERVSEKLKRQDQLVTEFGAAILGATLNEELGTLWRERGELSVAELWGYFTRYTYLPRLVNRDVLDEAIRQARSVVLVGDEQFAISAGKDAETGRYRGLIVPPVQDVSLQVTDSTLLIEMTRAKRQQEEDRVASALAAAGRSNGEVSNAPEGSAAEGFEGAVDLLPANEGIVVVDNGLGAEPADAAPSRFFGSVEVDPERYARDIGLVMREVIDRLAGAGAKLEITIDVQASKPDGFEESEIRTISENARVLKFDTTSGFERG